MAADLHSKTQSPETLTKTVDAAVKEWRQIAIAEGIAPTRVDRYLLDRDDVPEDVKAFIRQLIDSEARAQVSASPETPVSQEGATPVPPVEAQSVSQPPPTEKGAELAGEVGMLNAKSEIQQIKEDVIQKSEQGIANEVQKRHRNSLWMRQMLV